MLRSMGHAGAIQPGDETAAPPSRRWRLRPRARSRAHPVAAPARGARHRAHDARTRELPAPARGGRSAAPVRRARSGPTIEQWIDDGAGLHAAGAAARQRVVPRSAGAQGVRDGRRSRSKQLVYPQLAAGERSVSAQQAFDLVALADVARREPAAVRYLLERAPDCSRSCAPRCAARRSSRSSSASCERYGHRGRYEYRLVAAALQRGSDAAAARAARAPRGRRRRPTRGRRAARRSARRPRRGRAFERRLSPWQRWTMLPRVRRAIRAHQAVLRVARAGALGSGARAGAAAALAPGARGSVRRARLDRHAATTTSCCTSTRSRRGQRRARRRRRCARSSPSARPSASGTRAIQMPLLMRESELPALIRMAGVSGERPTTASSPGMPVSGGCVEGEVVVVRDPATSAA